MVQAELVYSTQFQVEQLCFICTCTIATCGAQQVMCVLFMSVQAVYS